METFARTILRRTPPLVALAAITWRFYQDNERWNRNLKRMIDHLKRIDQLEKNNEEIVRVCLHGDLTEQLKWVIARNARASVKDYIAEQYEAKTEPAPEPIEAPTLEDIVYAEVFASNQNGESVTNLSQLLHKPETIVRLGVKRLITSGRVVQGRGKRYYAVAQLEREA